VSAESTGLVRVSNGPGDGEADWSPDGQRIAFTILRDLAWAGDITWFDADVPGPGSLTWSPDGEGIAYEFVDCDLFAGSGCSNERSVKYVSIDGNHNQTIIENARNPSWRR